MHQLQWQKLPFKIQILALSSTMNLSVLSNMENLNAVFIEQNMAQRERLVRLNQIAIHQMSILESGDNQNRKLLK